MESGERALMKKRLEKLEKQISVNTQKGIRHFIGILDYENNYSVSYIGTWKGTDHFKEKPFLENVPGLIDGSLEEYQAYKKLWMTAPVDDLLIKVVSNE